MKQNPPTRQGRRLRYRPLCAAVLAGCLSACASAKLDNPVSSHAAPAAAALKLQRVVMLMRHGVRSPTRAQVAPAALHDKPWPGWSVGLGELTAHGGEAVRLLGQWDRAHWAQRGLLPKTGCPAQAQVDVAASSKSRTQATARALIQGMAPGCQLEVDFPQSLEEDVEFHAIDSGAMSIDADEAMRAVAALLPAGGLQAEVNANAQRFELLNTALGCSGVRKTAACDLSAMPVGLIRNQGNRPDIGNPFGLASTISQTFLLEYLEGMPMQDVAWGRLSREQIQELLEFHRISFHYEGRAHYVAARAASPLAARMLDAIQAGPALTVLVGHDTNIADLGGLLDLHWQVPSYPRDDPPPGGALGFELLADASGKQFVRAFYRSQTMNQVRELQPLTATHAPSYEYLPIPGCAALCPLAEFDSLLRGKLVQPLPVPKKHRD